MVKKRTLLVSLNNAADGFIHVLRHERNMRVHFLAGFFILFLAAFLGVRRLEWMALCGSICFVLAAEMINTAIEKTIDFLHPHYNPTVGVIKDMSAGMVLVSALNAAAAGFLVFSKYLSWPLELTVFRLKQASWQLTFIALLTVVFLVIAGKSFGKKGSPFRGGAISGHAAIAFSFWTILCFAEASLFVIGITFLLAMLVAQSRLRAKIHSFWEVVAGGLVGILVTTLLFQVFK